jgi:hypothetical protein
VRVGNAVVADAVWTYESPYDALAAIRGHLAFYPDRVDAIDVGGASGQCRAGTSTRMSEEAFAVSSAPARDRFVKHLIALSSPGRASSCGTLGLPVLPVVPAAGERASHGTDEHEDEAKNQQDGPDSLENAQPQNDAQDKQNCADDDHAVLPTLVRG